VIHCKKGIIVSCQRIDFFMKSILVALRKKSDPKMPSCDIGKSSFMTCNVTGYPIYSSLMDPSVSMLYPLRRIDRSFRTRVSGCKHFLFIRFGAAPVSTMNSVSWRNLLAKIVTVGVCEKSLGFKTRFVVYFADWLNLDCVYRTTLIL